MPTPITNTKHGTTTAQKLSDINSLNKNQARDVLQQLKGQLQTEGQGVKSGYLYLATSKDGHLQFSRKNRFCMLFQSKNSDKSTTEALQKLIDKAGYTSQSGNTTGSVFHTYLRRQATHGKTNYIGTRTAYKILNEMLRDPTDRTPTNNETMNNLMQVMSVPIVDRQLFTASHSQPTIDSDNLDDVNQQHMEERIGVDTTQQSEDDRLDNTSELATHELENPKSHSGGQPVGETLRNPLSMDSDWRGVAQQPERAVDDSVVKFQDTLSQAGRDDNSSMLASFDGLAEDPVIHTSTEKQIFDLVDPQNTSKRLGSGGYNTAYEIEADGGTTQVLKLPHKPISFTANQMSGLRGLTNTGDISGKLQGLAGELAASRLTAKKINGVVTPTTYLLQRAGNIDKIEARCLKTYLHSNNTQELTYLGQLSPRAEGTPLKIANESEAAYITANLLGVLRGMATQGFIHRDLKPDNVIFQSETDTATQQMNVVDLGTLGKLSKKTSGRADFFAGTLAFVHPRVFNAVGKDYRNYGFEADLYSASMTLLNTRYPNLQTAMQYLALDQLVDADPTIRMAQQIKGPLRAQGVQDDKLDNPETRLLAGNLKECYNARFRPDKTQPTHPFTERLISLLTQGLSDDHDVNELRKEINDFQSNMDNEHSFENIVKYMLDASIASPIPGSSGRNERQQWCDMINRLSRHPFVQSAMETRNFNELEVDFDVPETLGELHIQDTD